MKDVLERYHKREDEILSAEDATLRRLQLKSQYPTIFALPLTVQFEVTNSCNLSCEHCYNSGPREDGPQLSNSDWISFVEDLICKGGIFEAIFSGGEPLLLGKTLVDIMRMLSRDGTHLVLISNGYLFDELFATQIADLHFYWIQISIDGDTADLHDAFRNHKGSFTRAVRAAILISDLGLPLFIAHTVTPRNLKRLPSMVEYAYRLGATTINIGDVAPSGRAFQSTERIFLNRDEKNMLLKQVNELSESYKDMSVVLSSSTWFQLKRNTIYPNSGFIVRPNGDVRLDCMAPFVIGNIKKDNWLTAWNEKGRTAWQHDAVQVFISGIERVSDLNPAIRNYSDLDVVI